MIFTDMSCCSMCGKRFGIGDRLGWAGDGYIYCDPCRDIREGELKRAHEEKKKAKKDV